MRRRYLDWLRGIAVLIMIEAHTLDSWTRLADRTRDDYMWAIVLGGFGAPVFLFLAGISLALASAARVDRGALLADVVARSVRRGLQIFALAFAFRLQSWLISGGTFPQSLLKVDILNIMGVSMMAAALLWGAGRRAVSRALALIAAAAAVAMLTPLIRSTSLLDGLPDAIEWYFRPYPGRTTFTLFPWGGFLLAGCAIGVWLDKARSPDVERRVNLALLVLGPALAFGSYAASYLPPIFAQTNFWTSSPTFFFLRLGVLITTVPLAYGWTRLWPGRSRMQEFGRASLFVYWIHVEMVYGVLSMPLHRRLPFAAAVGAFAAFSLFLYGVVKLKERLLRNSQHPTPNSQAVGRWRLGIGS